MGFDLSNATPVDQSDTSFDLANAKPVSKVQNYTLPDSSMHTSLGGPLPADAIPNGKQSPLTSGWDTFWSGVGKAPVDLARGAGQWLGLESRNDVAESRKLDAPLMATTAGKVGNLTGNIATMLPTAFVPGANTVAGASTIGSLSGLLQPSTSSPETLENAGLGGATGGASILGGRLLAGGYNLGRGLVEPFLPGGPTRIAARALQTFAGSPQDAQAAATALKTPVSALPGVQPTTAELAGNPGLSQLQRSLQNNPQFLTALTNRNQANRSAMTQALGGIAGTPEDLAAAEHTRSLLSGPLYDQAATATAPADDTLKTLMARPSMSKAWTRAQQLAEERGTPLVSGVDMPAQTVESPLLSALSGNKAGSPFTTNIPAQAQTYSGRGIQYLKMAMNDMANTAEQRGLGAHESNALKSTLSDFNDWTMQNVPQLRAADRSFQDLSRPINQFQVGQQLSNKLIPALNDFGSAGGLNASNYANAVRNGDQLAANATGWKGSTLANTLSPSQMKTVQQVGEQLARTASTNVGRAVGSNTAQNLIGQDILGQTLGPMGLPRSWAQSVLSKTLMRPIQYAAQAAEPHVLGLMQQAALDPQMAAGLLQMTKNPALAKALWARQGLLTAPSLATSQALSRALVNSSQQ